jgi:hypothetical protein
MPARTPSKRATKDLPPTLVVGEQGLLQRPGAHPPRGVVRSYAVFANSCSAQKPPLVGSLFCLQIP